MGNPIGDREVVEYLLGALPEDQAERLDELSVSDDEFAARLRDAENELIDSYVGGELTGELRERFESFYLTSPLRREKVAFARGFQSVINRVGVAQGLGVARPLSEPSSRGRSKPDKGPRSWFFLNRRMAWGLTGALVLLVAVSWLAIQNVRLRTEVDQIDMEYQALRRREAELQSELQHRRSSELETQKELAALRERLATIERERRLGGESPAQEPSVIAVVLAPQTRGVSQMPRVEVPGDVDYVAMRLELERGDLSFYRAELKSLADNKTVWRSGRLRGRGTGESKSLNINLPAGLLRPQRYLIKVSGIAAEGKSEVVGSYAFVVVRP